MACEVCSLGYRCSALYVFFNRIFDSLTKSFGYYLSLDLGKGIHGVSDVVVVYSGEHNFQFGFRNVADEGNHFDIGCCGISVAFGISDWTKISDPV